MPELPDVETYKRYLDATALHQTIASVDVADPRMIADSTPQSFAGELVHRRFERTHRHGKYLFVRLDSEHWLMMHFGMSGSLAYVKSRAHEPRYAQVLFCFTNGAQLAYVAPRKLGRLALVKRPEQFVARQRLGPDALALGPREFSALAEGRRGSVKSWLLDQHALAGIGNLYSDEILFQAGLHPQRAVAKLSGAELRRLHRKLSSVLARAIAARGDPAAMPRSWLLPHRRKGGRCPKCKVQLRQDDIGGRTSYFCPHCQVQR